MLPPGSTAEDYYQAGLSLCQPDSFNTREAIAYFQKAVELNPNYLQAWCKLAQKLTWHGRYTEALECCDRALALKPDSFDAWSYRARALHSLDQFEEALASYERAIALDPQTPLWDVWSNRGHILTHLKRLEEALISYDRAIQAILSGEEEHDPQGLDRCYGYKGNALFQLGRYEEAIASYNAAEYLDCDADENRVQAYVALGHEKELLDVLAQQLAPPSEIDGDTQGVHWIWAKRGDVLMQATHYQEALTCYWKAFELAPLSYESHLKKALQKLEYSDDEITVQIVVGYDRALIAEPENSQLWFAQARFLEDANRHEAALASYDCVLDIAPNNAYAWNSRAVVLERLGRYAEAVASIDRGLALNLQADPLYQPDHSTLQFKAQTLIKAGHYEEAIATYDAALRMALLPNDQWELWHQRGLALFDLDRFVEAIASYDHAIEQLIDCQKTTEQETPPLYASPNYQAWLATVWFNKGVALARLEQWQEAIASYDQALEFDPQYFDAQYWRSFPLLYLERDEEALASFDQAIELQPENGEIWFYRGDVLSNLARYEEAIASYHQAITLLSNSNSPNEALLNEINGVLTDLLDSLEDPSVTGKGS